MSTPDGAPIQVDPVLVLRKVQQGSELGAALVRAAAWEVQADARAVEIEALRGELADRAPATEPDPTAEPGS